MRLVDHNKIVHVGRQAKVLGPEYDHGINSRKERLRLRNLIGFLMFVPLFVPHILLYRSNGIIYSALFVAVWIQLLGSSRKEFLGMYRSSSRKRGYLRLVILLSIVFLGVSLSGQLVLFLLSILSLAYVAYFRVEILFEDSHGKVFTDRDLR